MATSERWERIERLYHAALNRDERDRAAFLRDECDGEPDLRREVESFLAYDTDSQTLLSGQAIDMLAAWPLGVEALDSIIGYHLGPYEITAWLGSGGMGDVYRARDTRLGRDVAIKILPALFDADSGRRARFEREARVLAALNHPNVGSIYGFEERDGLHALVLELVDGGTLADRLHRGPLPIREALGIAGQIAAALEAAHGRDIVHRDLKPRNIAIARDGTVKVLDFGLAKAALGESPAMGTPPAGDTHEGTMLGTPQYMSPEQVRGQDVDERTDIWAFGCVLLEMLTGRPAFATATVSDTLEAILSSEPDWHALPPATPPAIVRLVNDCLEKDRTRRLADMAKARIEIVEALREPSSRGVADSPATSKSRRAWIVAGVAAILLFFVALGARRDRTAEMERPTRLSVTAPGQLSPQLSAVVSPDGRRLAFVATSDVGGLMLWVRELDALTPRVLPGTENAAHPFWSPDGRRIGFLSGGSVRTIALTGGPIQTLAETAERAGPSWGADDQILFVPRLGELGTVPAGGGPVTTVVANLGEGRQATWPQFLPDGRHFLFFVRSAKPDERGIYIGTIGDPRVKRILPSEFKAAYADGHLLFVTGETLMAQPFDLSALETTGAPVRIAEGVWTAAGAAQASFSVSNAGVLAYVNAKTSYRQFAWLDRRGRLLQHVGEAARYEGPFQMAPDGRRILVARGAPDSQQVWLLDSITNAESRITFGPDRQTNPVWSPDGTRIAIQSRRDQTSRLYLEAADGTGATETLYETDAPFTVTDWSPDGRFLVLAVRGPASLSDIWLLPFAGDRRPIPFLESRFNKTQATISPDSRWIAYTSYESGNDEVYVESFPTPGGKRQVSAHGGVQPRWRADGRELFYVSPDRMLTAVPVELDQSFRVGTLAPLFKLPVIPQGSQSIGLSTLYAAAPDGLKFLTVVPPDGSDAPITVILNWTAALHGR